MKHLLVEGWRGVNHSYALVNQYQLLEILQRPQWQVSHHDLPFAMAHWNRQNNGTGFNASDMAALDGIAPHCGQTPDAILRVASPIHAVQPDGVPQFTFMVTELGLSDRSFANGDPDRASFTAGPHRIITPTNWSKARLLDFGFDAERVHVVPHGVRMSTFHPLSTQERDTNRSNLGLRPDEFVFLNLGVATWNKGLDLLLVAFARARQRHGHVRLILKDQRDLYGISVEPVLKDVSSRYPDLFTADTLGAILFVPGNLQPSELRLLYGVADCYVSPYRGEGFNLPVLEAIACGTPVVVTEGGATDDFCPPEVATRVPSREGVQSEPDGRVAGRYREVDEDALLAAMLTHVEGWRAQHPLFAVHGMDLAQRMSWARAVDQLLFLMEHSQ
jgi:glycosyltransferase involved in cell wall biosynthesis